MHPSEISRLSPEREFINDIDYNGKPVNMLRFWKKRFQMGKQLYEWFFLKKNEIKKKQKNISSELLESFAQQITETEDIFQDDTHCAPVN